MKTIVVLISVMALAYAKPGLIAAPVAVAVPVSYASQYHAQDELGQYSYGYASPLSSKAEVKTVDGITRGGYSYLDAEGKLQTVQYTSDAINGFRVEATNLPKTPEAPILQTPIAVEDTVEVANAKARHMAALQEAEQRAKLAVPQAAAVLPKTVLATPIYAYAIPQTYGYTTYSHHIAAPVISAYSAPVFNTLLQTIPNKPAPEKMPNQMPIIKENQPELMQQMKN